MTVSILATKLYIPPPRPHAVLRPRLIERLNEGLQRKLTLISAPAGFGKTTLVSEWIAASERPAAWLSLDEGDKDPIRFLTYLIAALQTVEPSSGNAMLVMLDSPQPPTTEFILTALINNLTTVPRDFIVVLDDYQVIDSQPVDHALTFLLTHLPPQIHLVIITREDPQLPLSRLRAKGQLSELRVADLRFTRAEAAAFLNQGMRLNLSVEDVAALETRTEGWIAGLQLAAISMQGHADVSGFIQSFTGTHHFVLDYLLEEVLQQQPENVQLFLLRTSILDRLCGALCDAVLGASTATSQQVLESIERANLFLIPLDHDRRWYRYHPLFADLLRQRLSVRTGDSAADVTELHRRASIWYEANGLPIEAFRHAAAVHDIDRAARLIEGDGMPLHFRRAGAPVQAWLESLSRSALDARPSLWLTYASAMLFSGQIGAIEPKLQAAEAALERVEPDAQTRDLIGRIASMRATLAIMSHDAEAILVQSRRALEYLHPDNHSARTGTTYTLGYAYQIRGDRAAASQAYARILAAGKSSPESIYTIASAVSLGQLQEADNCLFLAAETYRLVLELAGDPPQSIACEAYLGLARLSYQWNDLDAAAQDGQQCLHLTGQIEGIDTVVSYRVFAARLKLAQGDAAGAADLLAEAEALVRQHHYEHQIPNVVAMQVLTLLHQGNLTPAAHLAETYDLPVSQARVRLAQGDPAAALALLDPVRGQMAEKGWRDELLRVLVLQAVAYAAHGETVAAVQALSDALALAEVGGLIRIFLDEGYPMAQLLSEAAARGIKPDYSRTLLSAFEAGQPTHFPPARAASQTLFDSLSERELEVLQLIAQGLSNREISERLFLALDTVKGHNRRIFDKLNVQRRTEAVARAHEIGLV